MPGHSRRKTQRITVVRKSRPKNQKVRKKPKGGGSKYDKRKKK